MKISIKHSSVIVGPSTEIVHIEYGTLFTASLKKTPWYRRDEGYAFRAEHETYEQTFVPKIDPLGMFFTKIKDRQFFGPIETDEIVYTGNYVGMLRGFRPGKHQREEGMLKYSIFVHKGVVTRNLKLYPKGSSYHIEDNLDFLANYDLQISGTFEHKQ